MRRFLFALALTLLLPTKVWATWSIIALDKNTGRVIIASATCAANQPDQLKLLQAVVLPGLGVAAAQAGVDGTHANQKLIFEEMRRGTDPKEIIRMLEEDPRLESRQFGIIDMQGRTAGRSGSSNGAVSLDFQGETPEGIVWSVQGNIIATTEALSEAARIMNDDRGDLIDRVMLAMEKANEHGGDRRCTCDNVPEAQRGLACNGRTASVSYLLVADRNDARGVYAEYHPQVPGRQEGDPTNLRAPWNDGNYFLYLAVYPSNIEAHEDASPVRTLRMRYDQWKADGSRRSNRAAPSPPAPNRMPGDVNR